MKILSYSNLNINRPIIISLTNFQTFLQTFLGFHLNIDAKFCLTSGQVHGLDLTSGDLLHADDRLNLSKKGIPSQILWNRLHTVAYRISNTPDVKIGMCSKWTFKTWLLEIIATQFRFLVNTISNSISFRRHKVSTEEKLIVRVLLTGWEDYAVYWTWWNILLFDLFYLTSDSRGFDNSVIELKGYIQ